jgi:tol-pal system protein YbgF
MKRRFDLIRLPLAISSLAVFLLVSPALAQNTVMQALLNKVDRLQREISTLQRQVYRGESRLPAAAQPLPVKPAPADPQSAARNSVRLAQLENEIRRLTGQMEEVDFRIREIQARLDKLVADMDQRLTTLEGSGQPVGDAAAAPRGTQPLAPLPQAATPALTPPPSATLVPPNIGSQPGVLGTIPKNLAVTSPKGPVAPPIAPPPSATARTTVATPVAQPVLPPGTPKSQYDYALSLMRQKLDFAAAEIAFKAFIEQHPKDGLTGNAYFWLGQTFYARKSFQDAVFAFAEGFQKFPTGTKAPDSLLKLGMSLSRLNKQREACTTYGRLFAKFPKASPRLKARADRERIQAKCR